jgi:hypothetical protein
MGCKVIFSVFHCILVDGVEYLSTDLSIRCDSTAHHSAEIFASFMVVAFPLGLPALYFFILYHNR